MKRFNSLLVASLAITLGLATLVIAAGPTTVTVSTAVPNGSVNGAAAFTFVGYPNITGGAKIRKVYIANQGGTAVGETVSIWNTCTSSSTASLKWQGIVKGTETINVDFLPGVFTLTSPCVSRGTNDTLSVLKATLFYE